MTATIRNLITVLEAFFPGAMSLKKGLSILALIASLYPLSKLHENQRTEPRQPQKTAWLKSITTSIAAAFRAESANLLEELESDSEENEHGDSAAQAAQRIAEEVSIIYSFLGFEDRDENPQDLSKAYFPNPRPILCTTRVDCRFCIGSEARSHSLRRRDKPHVVKLLNSRFQWTTADIFVAHCPSCHAEYFPDKVTYRNDKGERVEKYEFDNEYYRVSKHGIWMHRQIALAQEKALLRFHSGWSNFADWLNDTIATGPRITYRQSQRLFIEHFTRRLLTEHKQADVFTCNAHPSSAELAEAVRNVVGRDGGVLASSMDHGCMDCTHAKRYHTDLVAEGFIAESDETENGVADIPDLAVGLIKPCVRSLTNYGSRKI